MSARSEEVTGTWNVSSSFSSKAAQAWGAPTSGLTTTGGSARPAVRWSARASWSPAAIEHTRPRVLKDMTDFAPGQTGVDRGSDAPGFLGGEVGDLIQERVLVRDQDRHSLARHHTQLDQAPADRVDRRSHSAEGHRRAAVDERTRRDWENARRPCATRQEPAPSVGPPAVASLALFGGPGVNSATPKSSCTAQLLALS